MEKLQELTKLKVIKLLCKINILTFIRLFCANGLLWRDGFRRARF